MSRFISLPFKWDEDFKRCLSYNVLNQLFILMPNDVPCIWYIYIYIHLALLFIEKSCNGCFSPPCSFVAAWSTKKFCMSSLRHLRPNSLLPPDFQGLCCYYSSERAARRGRQWQCWGCRLLEAAAAAFFSCSSSSSIVPLSAGLGSSVLALKDEADNRGLAWPLLI